MSITVILIGIFFLIVVIVGVLVFVVARKKSTTVVIKKSVNIEKDEITLKQLIEIAADKNSSHDLLSRASIKLASSFPFPQRENKTSLTNEQKVYLNFILLLASHRNADAKLIAYTSNELKKKNPDYKKELDFYETEGLRQRMHRK